MLGFLERDFWDVRRTEGGLLDRWSMDYVLRDAGIRGRDARRRLREILVAMQAAGREEWKLRKPEKNTDH